MIIQSKLHKEIRGHVDGESYHVLFDDRGRAEVEDAVGAQLLRLSDATEVRDGIDKMTIPQMKEYAEQKGIELGEATKKPDILAAIKNFENSESESQQPNGSTPSEDGEGSGDVE